MISMLNMEYSCRHKTLLYFLFIQFDKRLFTSLYFIYHMERPEHSSVFLTRTFVKFPECQYQNSSKNDK